MSEVVLVRHAQTEWSADGRHTGRTDIPLTEEGRAQARALRRQLDSRVFAAVLVSPARRALETCALCGLDRQASARADLQEWNYGDYEGRTSAQIQAERPGWALWRDGCPGGETVADVGVRADRVIAELAGAGGDVAVFSHGHMLRVLGARWIGLPPQEGARLSLSPASLSALAREHEIPVISRWNAVGP